MSVLLTGSPMDQITNALSVLTVNVKLNNSRGRTDVNKDAEDFYCGLLNLVLDAELKNMNLLRMDFPAIDLADCTNRICVQVTSTNEREKIDGTLKKFYVAELDSTPLTECFERLVVLIIGDKKAYQSRFPKKEGFAFNPSEDIWDTSRLLGEIEKLNLRRRQRVLDYLKENMSLRTIAPFVLELPVPEFRSPTGFLGREEELAQIRSSREKPIILHGLGGVGKTVLASQYAREWEGKVYFLRFNQSFCHTLADGVGQFLPEEERKGKDENALADRALELLRQGGSDALLIVDNAEKDGVRWLELTADPYYEKLRHLPLRLLMTTRMQGGGIKVGSLPREQLHEIFKGHGLNMPLEEMDDLIDSVDGHTITVDLIARTLREGGGMVKTEDILTAIRNSTLPQADFDEVETDHERQQRQIYGHLREIFNLSGVTEDGRVALACATLLPDGGMDGQWFLKALRPGPCKEIKNLEKRGWVDSYNNHFTIHPVIRIVCREELKPSDKICADFLIRLWDQYDPNDYSKEKYRQLAETFTLSHGVLEDSEGLLANWAGVIWSALGEVKLALKCNQSMVEKLEKTMPNSEALVAAYNNVGSTYDAIGDHQKALEYKLTALRQQESGDSGDRLGFALTSNNVGCTYLALGDGKKALEYLLRALEIREKMLAQNHLDLAQSYNNVGVAHGHLGEHEEALIYKLKALGIREKTLSKNHPDLAQSYHNVGSAYITIGDNNQALKYLLKALEILEQTRPENHSDLMICYHNLCSAYDALGDHRKELPYRIKVLEIRERILEPNDSKIVEACTNIAVTYAQLDEFDQAVPYIRRAVGIAGYPEHPQPNLEYLSQLAQRIELLSTVKAMGMYLPNPFKK